MDLKVVTMPEQADCFAKYDVVVLKSGGPLMTVISSNPQETTCIWFDGMDMKQPDTKFPTDALLICEQVNSDEQDEARADDDSGMDDKKKITHRIKERRKRAAK